MKHLFIGLFLACFITALAQEPDPVSFRSQALGGIINDDLDLIYDPVELRFVTGFRFYTNLSNLGSGEEQFLNNRSDDEFLFGTSFKLPINFKLWTSLLARYQDSQVSNDIQIDANLDGMFDIFDEGSFFNVYTGFIDTDGDGLYDIKNLISQDKSNFTRRKRQSYILNTTTLISDWTFGLKFLTGKQETENTTAFLPMGSGFGQLQGVNPGDPSFNLEVTRDLIQTNFNDFNWMEQGYFFNGTKTSQTALELAAMRPFFLPVLDTVELRADLGMSREEQNRRISDRYSGFVEYDDQNISNYQDTYQEAENILNEMETKGNRWLAVLSLKRIFQKAPERKNDGYWQFRTGFIYTNFNYHSTDHRDFSSDQYFENDNNLIADFSDQHNELNLTTDSGDLNSLQYFVNILVNIQLGQRVYTGAGLFYDYTGQDQPTVFSTRYNRYQNFDRLGYVGIDDFQRWEESRMTADRQFEQDISNFIFPVGIEYLFTDNRKWSFRLGSIFHHTKIVTNDVKNVTGSEPLIITTIDGNGNEEIEIFDNIYESSSSHKKSSESNTSYYYGLGFSPSDNLQIDLLGFLGEQDDLQLFDTEFLRSIRFSFTIKL